MVSRIDAAGNVVGRYEGDCPGLPALLIGFTSTPSGTPANLMETSACWRVAAVAELNRRAERLPFAIEVVGFGDEEGVRFPVTLTGSRALAGTFDPAALAAVDADGIGYAEALRAFGGDPDAIATAAKQPDEVLAYVEAHIERGRCWRRRTWASASLPASTGRRGSSCASAARRTMRAPCR